MKTNELRIGNLISEGSDILTVGNIYQEGFDFIYNSGCRFVDIKDCKPISLTEEIFKTLKPEFQYIRSFSDFYDLQGITVEVLGSGLPDTKFFIGSVEIKSIHQLQNLYFALKKKELIINH